MPIILNVRVDNLTWEEAVKKAGDFLRLGGQHKIFTPNPEMLVKANKDDCFKQVLNSGDINLCDGFGLSVISRAKRITGIDFMLVLCEIAAVENKSVFLLGSASDEIAKKTAEELIKKNPLLNIVGHSKGPEIDELRIMNYELRIDQIENENVIQQINASGAEVLFVAFGMGKQEKWIVENLPEMPNVKIAMGVGGSFDYISGTVKRAPCWMRKIGLEWMWRLIRQPSRIMRILNATFVYCFLIVKKCVIGDK